MEEDSVKKLTKSNSVEEQDMIVSWDEMIEKGLGNFGWTQFLQCILVSVAMYFDSQQVFIAIYTDDYPTWHCTNHTTTCTSDSNICKISKSSWAWDGPSSKTIISHFGLECATSFITGLPQSSFFVGCLVGSFLLSSLADSSFGRKNMIIMSCLSMSVISLVIIFSTNVWIYSALKFLIGFCRSSISTCCLVLLTEKVSTKWRFTVGIVEFFFFTSGYLSLPGVAYLNRHSSWKYLYVWTSVPAVCYSLVAYLSVTESPRWLLMQGRVQEAMAMLKGVSYSSAENGASSSASLPKAPVKEGASRQQELSLPEETSLSHCGESRFETLLREVPIFSAGSCFEQDCLERTTYMKNQEKEGASHQRQQELDVAKEISLSNCGELRFESPPKEMSTLSVGLFLQQNCVRKTISAKNQKKEGTSHEQRLEVTGVSLSHLGKSSFESSLREVSMFNIQSPYLRKKISKDNNKEEGAPFSQLYSSIAMLFKTSWAPKRMVAVMGLGVGIGMVYFGMPLAVGNLDYNIYLAVVYNALMEIPSCIVTYFLGSCARKLSIFAFSLGSGICCIMCVVIRNGPKGVKVWLAVASFFCACTAFNVFLIYIIELFPTCVRNTTASLARQAVVFGCIFSPFLISAGRKNDLFSYGVFGVVIICSTFTLLCLPETKGISLSDTMDQQELKETSLCEMGGNKGNL